MSATVQLGRGRASMSVTGATARELRGQVEAILGPALRILEREVEDFKASEIDPTWPNATGTSAAAWSIRASVDGESVGVALVNSSGYAQYVRSARYGRRLRPGGFRNAFAVARRAFTARRRSLELVLRAELAEHIGGLSGR